jgi:hypothetical protein
MAFPSPEFIPPRPTTPGVHRPSRSLHRGTWILFFTLILFAAILELYPLADRADVHNFAAQTIIELGFPLPFLTSWTNAEGPELDAGALLVDVLAAGALIVSLTSWTERWLRLPGGAPWYKLHFRTVFFLLVLILGGVGLEVYPTLNKYTDADERRNVYFDNLWFHNGCLDGGLRWSGRGIPFTYHRVDPVQTPETAGYIAMHITQETRFYPTILIFDFILVGLAIAEATHWFEKRRRTPRVVIVGDS